MYGTKRLKAESCSTCGVHPSAWDRSQGGHPNGVVPVWRHCRVCELVEAARDAGPPEPAIKFGWRLELQHNHHLSGPPAQT